MNQTQAVKEYLESGKTLTSMEAFEKFGCTRLSAKIFDLREKGYDIETIKCESSNRYGDIVHYAKYKLINKPEEK